MNVWMREHRRSVIVGAAIGLMVALGVAVALWLINIRPEGYVKGGQLQALTDQQVTAGELAGTLLPGGESDITLRLTNPNSVPLFVKQVEIDPLGSIVSDDPTACPAANVSFTGPFDNLRIGPVEGGATTDVQVPGVAMSADAPTACQGNRFSIDLIVTLST